MMGKEEMKEKIVSVLMLTLILTSILNAAFLVRPTLAKSGENNIFGKDFMEKSGETTLPNKAIKPDQANGLDSSWRNIFETVTKCGTGFTDEDLAKLPKTMQKHVIAHKHPRVQSMIEADVWFEPVVVIEVLGAEITLSPIHTCALNVIREGSGLAIRFPRFTGNYRFDKSAEDATTTAEIVEMYRNQLKKVSES